MRAINYKQLKIVYEPVSLDPAKGQELNRGFDILFDIVIKAELDALELRKMPSQNKEIKSYSG